MLGSDPATESDELSESESESWPWDWPFVERNARKSRRMAVKESRKLKLFVLKSDMIFHYKIYTFLVHLKLLQNKNCDLELKNQERYFRVLFSFKHVFLVSLKTVENALNMKQFLFNIKDSTY